MFSQHPKARFWSSKNQKNPDEVKLNSHTKFWFDCECGHEIQRALNEVNRGVWCGYCANKRICSEENNCSTCIDKSVASVEYSQNWSDKNTESPFEVFKNSPKKCWFVCPVCEHTFQQRLSHITRGSTCGYCNGGILLCHESLNCITCFNKSFASFEKSKYWSPRNVLKPIQVFKHSGTKQWFCCDKCDTEFESRISHIADGSWCPNCRYKTEDNVYKILVQIHPTIKTQFKVEWCKELKYLPFDFVLEDRKIIIELDGEHHFIQVAKWKTPEHNRKRDLYKMKCANENGFSIIRLLQDDVYKNRYDWLGELNVNIEQIRRENRVQNIYMCKKNEYFDFPEIMLTT
jgi:very-short-patch-repair endonuclease